MYVRTQVNKGYNDNDKNMIKLIYKDSSGNTFVKPLIGFNRADRLSSLSSIVPDT